MVFITLYNCEIFNLNYYSKKNEQDCLRKLYHVYSVGLSEPHVLVRRGHKFMTKGTSFNIIKIYKVNGEFYLCFVVCLISVNIIVSWGI